jgi:IS5 family transposase
MPQLPLAESWGNHPQAQELRDISALLDQMPDVVGRVHADLVGKHQSTVGCPGLSGEQTLRLAVLKQVNQISYEDLAFVLVDSRVARTFSRLPLGWNPSSSTLGENIKRISPETWELINRAIVGLAREKGVESGDQVRTDCTVVEANVLDPNDARLLWDCVRVMTRVAGRIIAALPEVPLDFVDRTRVVKGLSYEIQFLSRGDHRTARYCSLLDLVGLVNAEATDILVVADKLGTPSDDNVGTRLRRLMRELESVLEATKRVLSQTKRRIVDEETVPASEKLVSIFEQHTSIIRKDHRDTFFGHKICLSGGASSLILDCLVLDGNPADVMLVAPVIDRLKESRGGRAPLAMAFDGSFPSAENLAIAKAAGVVDVCFHKSRGLTVADMVSDDETFRRLKNFRAGIEGGISMLKRVFGLGRCLWRGLTSFKSYVLASIVSFNLVMLARRLVV